ncbi:hypothetical protein GGU11DRAFT_755015 [Lentinula aff. detonsa]|nr:hypothetical protein GGU11DRAFT_755015 [Lentinula aff. detonsa]
MKFTSPILAGSLLLLSPAAVLAQDSSSSIDTTAAESSALSAASSVISADGGSVTVIAGQTITIPSGISIPAIPTAILSDTSLIASLASSLTATLTGSLASEASSILSEITGGGASGASSAATATGSSATGSSATVSGSSAASASTTGTSGNGALSLEGGVKSLIASVGAGLLAASSKLQHSSELTLSRGSLYALFNVLLENARWKISNLFGSSVPENLGPGKNYQGSTTVHNFDTALFF